MALGFDIGGSLGVVNPDKGFSQKTTPRVYEIQFGDGFQQRGISGINNNMEEFSVNFANRPKDEIDDIEAFFESKNGVTNFSFTHADSNESGDEKTIKVICSEWSKTYSYDDYYSLSATFKRVYEA
jgi:phage-related protein